MLTLVVIVFLGVFALAVLLMTASRTDASKQSEQTMSVLQAALATTENVGNRSGRRYSQTGTAQRPALAQSLALKARNRTALTLSHSPGQSEMDCRRIASHVRPLFRGPRLSDLLANRSGRSSPCYWACCLVPRP